MAADRLAALNPRLFNFQVGNFEYTDQELHLGQLKGDICVSWNTCCMSSTVCWLEPAAYCLSICCLSHIISCPLSFVFPFAHCLLPIATGWLPFGCCLRKPVAMASHVCVCWSLLSVFIARDRCCSTCIIPCTSYLLWVWLFAVCVSVHHIWGSFWCHVSMYLL